MGFSSLIPDPGRMAAAVLRPAEASCAVDASLGFSCGKKIARRGALGTRCPAQCSTRRKFLLREKKVGAALRNFAAGRGLCNSVANHFTCSL